MERLATTTKEVALEKIIDLPSVSKENFVLVCSRMGEDYTVSGKPPEGWGDCRICIPNFLASKEHKDFIPNSECGGYIPYRAF